MPTKFKITLISATSNNNYQLAQNIDKLLQAEGFETGLVNLEEVDLPLYTPEREDLGIPTEAKELSLQLQESHGLVLCAPEYNGSIPPIVTNAIAWVSRTGGDWRVAFNEKVGIVGTHSGGGGIKVCQAMRLQLEHLGCLVLPRNIIVNSSQGFKEDSTKKIISTLLKYLA